MPHVHLEDGFEEAQVKMLREALPGEVGLTVGKEMPAETNILVSGRPDPALLDGEALQAVIVPFAGIPPQTREAIRERPRLKLYNLHHNDMATAEMAVALLLDCARKIAFSDRLMRQGTWRGRQEEGEAFLLAGRRAMIFGYGHIGKQIGKVLEALGMEIIGIRREARDGALGFDLFRQVLPTCHVLVVAAPLTDETRGAIGHDEIAAMMPPRLIVNIGRGPIIDELALYDACKEGVIQGAGIDVWYQYPDGDAKTFPSQYPIHELDNVVLSPHTGGGGDTIEPMRMRYLAVLIRAILNGENPRAVDIELGY